MTEEIWIDLLSEQDREVIRRGAYGKSRGLGIRPAVLVVDCQYNYVGDDVPITEQQDRWPGGGGAVAWKAVRQIAPILDRARAAGVPVIYSRNVVKRNAFDGFAVKIGRDMSATHEGAKGTSIVEEIAPTETDVVIDKGSASMFWGTLLDTHLVSRGIDSLIIVGVSTSGCVRSTLVDGVARGYHTAVVADGVADRIGVSHRATLLDIWMKYGDVLDADGAIRYLDALPSSQAAATSDSGAPSKAAG